jgi:outer membrane lipoprotein-sorting protein
MFGLVSALFAAIPAQAQTNDNIAAIMERMQHAMASINDYTCLFGKRELLKNEIHQEDSILLKIKKPQHFYMKWTSGPNKDRVVIYVSGRNKNKTIVHLTGLMRFLPVSIDPTGKQAMKYNRHPITEAGIGHIIDLCAADSRRCSVDPACNPIVATPIGTDTLEINGTFPQGKGYYAHKVRIIVDKHLWLPVKITCFGWSDEFLEEYRFDNIKINVKLKEKDFEIQDQEN